MVDNNSTGSQDPASAFSGLRTLSFHTTELTNAPNTAGDPAGTEILPGIDRHAILVERCILRVIPTHEASGPYDFALMYAKEGLNLSIAAALFGSSFAAHSTTPSFGRMLAIVMPIAITDLTGAGIYLGHASNDPTGTGLEGDLFIDIDYRLIQFPPS